MEKFSCNSHIFYQAFKSVVFFSLTPITDPTLFYYWPQGVFTDPKMTNYYWPQEAITDPRWTNYYWPQGVITDPKMTNYYWPQDVITDPKMTHYYWLQKWLLTTFWTFSSIINLWKEHITDIWYSSFPWIYVLR